MYTKPILGFLAVIVSALLWLGSPVGMVHEARAATGQSGNEAWSSTKPYPKQDVYYPGTEELGADEMRVIACGTGMPTPRLKQVI